MIKLVPFNNCEYGESCLRKYSEDSQGTLR